MTLQIELLEESFRAMKPDFEAFVSDFYTTLFTDYPAIAPLFAHTNMSKQRMMLFAALTLVIENLRNPDVLAAALTGLGTRHVQYGAVPAYYPLFGKTLLQTMQRYLQEGWTAEMQQAWTEAYAIVTRLMLQGTDYDAVTVQLDAL